MADGLDIGGGGLPTGFALTAASVVDCSTASEAACRDNELGYMYYHNLGGTFGDDLTGNQGLIQNLANVYLSGTARAPDIDQAWDFSFNGAFQFLGDDVIDEFNAWAVRDGDVSPIQPPAFQELGDLNDDGMADLVWRNVSTGAVSGWLMNGLAIASDGPIAMVGDPGWTIRP